MTEKTLPNDNLASNFLTRHLYTYGLGNKLWVSDALKFVAEHGGAYWLVHEIALAQALPIIADEDLQYWKLAMYKDRTATLTCCDKNGSVIRTKHLDWADFSRDELRLICQDGLLMLEDQYWHIV